MKGFPDQRKQPGEGMQDGNPDTRSGHGWNRQRNPWAGIFKAIH